MNTVMLTASIAVLILVAIVVSFLLTENTSVLNEHKALREELADIRRQADAIGPHPTMAQVEALQARIDRYEQRYRTFRASPFVIDREP